MNYYDDDGTEKHISNNDILSVYKKPEILSIIAYTDKLLDALESCDGEYQAIAIQHLRPLLDKLPDFVRHNLYKFE